MSAWRRIAIEHVPSCKKTIEEAEHTVFMWLNLFLDLIDEEKIIDEKTAQEIHQFAFWCLTDWRQNKKANRKLSDSAYSFYESLLTSNQAKEQLMKYYSPEELTFLKKIYPEWFPADLLNIQIY